MATLDRFIELMFEKNGTGLILETDKPAALETATGRKPVTKEPIATDKIVGLLKEIIPQGMLSQLENEEGRETFGYELNGKKVDVEIDRAGASMVATIAPARARKSSAAIAQPAEALMMDASTAGTGGHQAATPATRDVSATAAAEERIQDLLRYLVESGSSDLHLRVGLPPYYRTDGELVRREDYGVLSQQDIESMVFGIMPDRNKKEFTDTNDTDYAYEILDLARFRVNALRDRMGMAAVFRVIPTEILTVDDLGVSEHVQKLCYLSKGLVVVTGPTGSGKSTTLAAMIDLINRTRSDHIITIEDPIEFVHQNKKCVLTQRQVGSHTQSFRRALRAALREDPDIVLIGEMRDLETVAIAIETAETGHLVLGTLHTTTAISTVDRIIDQFPADRQDQIRVMLSESLKGVIAQVLCKKKGGGRVAAREILLSIAAVSNLIREGKTFQLMSIIQTNKKLGMTTLNDSLLELVDKDLIEPEEAYIKSVDKAGIETALRSRNIVIDFKGE